MRFTTFIGGHGLFGVKRYACSNRQIVLDTIASMSRAAKMVTPEMVGAGSAAAGPAGKETSYSAFLVIGGMDMFGGAHCNAAFFFLKPNREGKEVFKAREFFTVYWL